MASATELNDTEQIRRLIRNISEAWLTGNVDRLNDFFDDRMAIRGPNLQLMGAGKQACVKSYDDFIHQTRVLQYEEAAPEIDLFGDTAVVICPWKITYEMKGQQHSETGRDLLVLVRDEQSWLVAWRALLPISE